MSEHLLQRDVENDGPLLQWIDAATHGLSDDSRERVSGEISEHFCDAVEECLAAGLSESDARAEALRDLGSSEDARRAFRRAYLTSLQEKWVGDRLRRPGTWLSWLYASMFLAATARVVTIAGTHTEWVLAVAVVAGMALSLTVLYLAVPSLRRRGRLRSAVGSGALADWLFYFSFLFGVNYLQGEHVPVYAALFATTFVILTLVYVPMLRKLSDHPFRPA